MTTRPFTSIERIAEPIGFDLGHSDSKVQGDLLNGFARGLSAGLQPGDVATQCAYIAEELTEPAKALLIELAGFCEADQ